MSDTSGAWYHCTRCGTLFKAAATPDERGNCPSCGGDPVSTEEPEAPAQVLIRRKVRKPKPASGTGKPRRHHHHKRNARALMIFVIAWGFGLGVVAITIRKLWPDATIDTAVVDETSAIGGQAMEDARLVRDQSHACGKRLQDFLAASDLAGQSPHVLHSERTLAAMVRAQQQTPIFASRESITAESYAVIHTPAGRGIESMWKQGDDKRIEAVFFEDGGEWKLDWHAFTRAGTEPWPLFLSDKGPGEGEFRVLARERIGAGGRDAEYIGLVLYAVRPGHPGEAVSPSPEVRVERSSAAGRLIEEAFAARKKGFGAYGSTLVRFDPDEMIRLRVRLAREGDEERVFRITELLACHWMELAEPKK